MSILDKEPKQDDLIFDVGLHRGEDTELYLKKGFRVVAFEANPELVSLCTKRFEEFIDRRQLRIVCGAIVEPARLKPRQRKVRFYRNESDSGWGTVCLAWADRNENSGHRSHSIEVDAIDFSQALREHGIPHYMKVDIEGCDIICVRALQNFCERPDYLSIESDKTSFRSIREEIRLLSVLGYQSFQAVEQSAVVSQVPPSPAREGLFAPHSFVSDASGLFGAELPGKWLRRSDVLRLYRFIRAGYYLLGDAGILNRPFRGASRLRSLARKSLGRITRAAVPGWYDTHARLS